MNANTQQLVPSLKALLTEGAEKLGLRLKSAQAEKLISYLMLLSRWNRVYNLTAIRNITEMVTHHLLDCMAVADSLEDAGHLLDVGSGAGLPGMVLAILYPDKPVALVDSVQKKTAFLLQVRTELQLRNVTVYTERVEKLDPAQKSDAIISRAFSDLTGFVTVSGHLLKENGCFYAMKGSVPEDEIGLLPDNLKVREIKPLTVPFLNEERHLLIIEKMT